MLDWNRPMNHAINLHAGAIGIDNAQDQKFLDVPGPLDSTEGELARHHVVPYQERNVPSIITYTRGTLCVVAIAGIQGGGDAMDVYTGWMTPVPIDGMPGRVNSFAKRWDDNTASVLGAYLAGGFTRFLFLGHSWGASLATIWANRTKRLLQTAEVRLVTYGGPRFADRVFLENLRVDDFARVMNYADPVTFLVPSFTEAPVFNSLHRADVVLAFNSYRHMSHGIRIKQGVQIIWNDAPEGLAYPLDVRPATVRTILSSHVGPHLTNEYLNVLAANAQSESPDMFVPHGSKGGGTVEEGVSITAKEAEEIAEWPDKPWPKAGQKGNKPGKPTPPGVVPGDAITPRSSSSYIYIKKADSRWWVYYHDTPIYRATGKRDARGWARHFRGFVKQYQQHPDLAINIDIAMRYADGAMPGS